MACSAKMHYCTTLTVRRKKQKIKGQLVKDHRAKCMHADLEESERLEKPMKLPFPFTFKYTTMPPFFQCFALCTLLHLNCSLS